MIQDMGDSAGEMLEAAGAKNIRTYAHPSAPRWALHEAGIARMGANPKNPSSTNSSRPTTSRIFSSWTLPASLQIPARTHADHHVSRCPFLRLPHVGIEAQFTLGSSAAEILSVRHTRRLDSAGEPFLTATLNLF